MRDEYCEACDTLETSAPTFVNNGVTTGISNRLKEDNGFGSGSKVDTDCEALNLANDCLIGGMEDELEKYDICDIKTWLANAWNNLHTVLKAMIAAICGLWDKVHCILSGLKILLQQLTDTSQTSSFAAVTKYAFSSGAGGAPYGWMGWNQRIVPTSGAGTQCTVDFLSPSLSQTEQSPSTIHSMPTADTNVMRVIGPGEEIEFDADGVAICGCCAVGNNWRGRNSMQVVFYTTKDIPDSTPLFYLDANNNVTRTAGFTTLLNRRGLHYGSYISNHDETKYGSMSNPMACAIKVKAGSKLRMFVRCNPSYSGNNADDIDMTHDMSGTPEYGNKWWNYYGGTYNDNGVETQAVIRAAGEINTDAKFGIHQIWCTFVPDFSSALSMSVDPHLFDNCGD